MSIDNKPPLTIEIDALAAIKEIIQKKQITKEYGLRVGVKGTGCSKNDFFIAFDKISEKDKVYDLEGLLLLIDRGQFMYLFGQKLKYKQDEDGSMGFVFEKS